MQEKNRLFILDLFRNCVDRVSNMRNFIARIAPSTGTDDKYNDTKRVGSSLVKRELGEESIKMEAVRAGSSYLVGRNSSSSSTGTAKNTGRNGQTVHIDLCSDDEQDICTKSSASGSSKDTSLKRTIDNMHSDAEVLESECIIVDTATDRNAGGNNSAQKKICHQSGTITTSVGHSGVMWTCSVCTFCHKEQGCGLFLQCSLCGSPRSK